MVFEMGDELSCRDIIVKQFCEQVADGRMSAADAQAAFEYAGMYEPDFLAQLALDSVDAILCDSEIYNQSAIEDVAALSAVLRQAVELGDFLPIRTNTIRLEQMVFGLLSQRFGSSPVNS